MDKLLTMIASEGGSGGMTEYIKHHLHHLEWKVGEGAFWTIHLDSVVFKFLAIAVFLFLFVRVARRSTAGVPGKLQCAIEMIVELRLWKEGETYERTGLNSYSCNLMGVEVPRTVIPVSPGKNITVIAEVIAMTKTYVTTRPIQQGGVDLDGARIDDIALPQVAELAGLQASGGFSAAESFAWHRRLLADDTG